MKIKKRKVLIIIRGAKPAPHFESKKIEKVRNVFFSKLSSRHGFVKENYDALAKFFSDSYDKVKQLKWDGDILKNPSLSIPIDELKSIMKKNKNCDIDIIAVSLGGRIIEKAFEQKGANKINQILYIGAVHNIKKKHSWC